MTKIILSAVGIVAVLCGLILNLHNIYYLVFITPAIMFLSGCIMYEVRTFPNCVFGYKTGMSMRNQDTWDFANRYSGMLWMKWSVPLLIVSELIMFLLKPSPAIAEGMILIQLIPVLAVIPFTEKALDKTFDRQGNRREEYKTEEEL